MQTGVTWREAGKPPSACDGHCRANWQAGQRGDADGGRRMSGQCSLEPRGLSPEDRACCRPTMVRPHMRPSHSRSRLRLYLPPPDSQTSSLIMLLAGRMTPTSFRPPGLHMPLWAGMGRAPQGPCPPVVRAGYVRSLPRTRRACGQRLPHDATRTRLEPAYEEDAQASVPRGDACRNGHRASVCAVPTMTS